MKKTIYSLLAAMAMAISLLVGAHGAAAAAPDAAPASDDVSIMGWPSGCADYQYNNGWLARCTKANGGSWMAFAVCQTEGGGPRFTRNPSVWQTVSNVPSYASCPPGSFVVDGGIWTSNTP
ncbi:MULTISPECIES: hypothetical protein [Glycomyces]|uniref:Secreted protein n=2 Tax=Glycomyces TaxID=58113 RepID=A0A9X3PKF3_9ACTN|nr:hypothetical protein [Glycomyces lechevalierae]MDA1387126.1 hypothetical protein [Glycomyces lechevalierae]MDR7336734.1 hypothetical protein [Glycomyces lechevalierae]